MQVTEERARREAEKARKAWASLARATERVQGHQSFGMHRRRPNPQEPATTGDEVHEVDTPTTSQLASPTMLSPYLPSIVSQQPQLEFLGFVIPITSTLHSSPPQAPNYHRNLPIRQLEHPPHMQSTFTESGRTFTAHVPSPYDCMRYK